MVIVFVNAVFFCQPVREAEKNQECHSGIDRGYVCFASSASFRSMVTVTNGSSFDVSAITSPSGEITHPCPLVKHELAAYQNTSRGTVNSNSTKALVTSVKPRKLVNRICTGMRFYPRKRPDSIFDLLLNGPCRNYRCWKAERGDEFIVSLYSPLHCFSPDVF